MLALAVGFSVGCVGSSGTKSSLVDEAEQATAVSDVAGTLHPDWSVPQLLAITPVAMDFVVADPAFEALPGAKALYGTYGGGAYQIEVPDDWNGEVLFFAHGFRSTMPELTITQPPNREYLIAHGYAWAASSYTANRYTPSVGARDTYALRQVFAEQVGRPSRSYLWGQSMGGNIVALSLEMYPLAYGGAVSECGALSARTILDYMMTWGLLAGHFAGRDLTQAMSGDLIEREFSEYVLPAFGDPDHLTLAGRRFADAMMYLSGGPRPFFIEGFKAQYEPNFTLLVQAMEQPSPANAVAQNVDAEYTMDERFGMTSDELNREVPRVMADARYLESEEFPEYQLPKGNIQRPLLTLHNTGDVWVPIAIEAEFRDIVDAAGRGDLLVQRAVRRAGHCMFSDAERNRAFEDLVGWVERGEKPAGEDLHGDLTNVGLQFTNPLEPDDPGTVSP